MSAITWIAKREIGEFISGITSTRHTAVSSARSPRYKGASRSDLPVRVAPGGTSNIICFTVAHQRESISVSNSRIREVYRSLSPEKCAQFFVSMTDLNWNSYGDYLAHFTSTWEAQVDAEGVTLLLLCLMNPFFNSQETRVNYTAEFINIIETLYSGLT